MIKDEKEPIALMWASHGFRNNVEAGYSGTVPGNKELAMNEFNRWAESLQDDFYRVLQEDISTLLDTPVVYRYD
jgi:hypothetical protein